MDILDDLLIRIMGDGRSYETAVNKAIGDTSKLTSEIGKNTSQLQGLTSRLGAFGEQAQGIIGMLAGGLGIGSFIGTIQTAIDKAANAEQIEIAFKSLIGNTELAMSTLEDLKRFAVSTPFELPQILEAAKSMLAYGQSAETIVPTMQRLGDVASALNIPLSSLTYLYGTLKSSGRVMTVDMRQFANRGIPIWLELAKVIGMVSKETRELTGSQSAQLQQMVSKGKITFDMIEKAFIGMTSEGGRFFNMMENQSLSFTGIISNLKDSLGLLLADVGKQIIEGFDLKRIVLEIRNFAQAAADWFKNLDPKWKQMLFIVAGVIAAIGVLVAGFLALKGIVIAFGAVISTVGWPFIIMAGIAIAAIALWVKKVGSIGKALDIVKAKFLEFWEFIAPVRQALVALFEAVWEAAQQVFDALLKVVTDVWNAITDSANINWTSIRDFIVDSILLAAYTIKNFKEIASLAFDYLKLKAIDTGYAWGRSFGIGGQIAVAAIEKVSGMRADAKREYEESLKKTLGSFAEFKRQAMTVKPDDVVPPKDVKETSKAAEEAGKQVGQAMKKGIKDGLGDAILFGSAEHLRMLDAYQQKLGAITTAGGPAAVAAAAGVGAAVMGEMPNRNAPVFENLPTQVFAGGGIAPDSDLGHKLDEIRDILKDQRNGPVLEVEGANVGID